MCQYTFSWTLIRINKMLLTKTTLVNEINTLNAITVYQRAELL